MEPRGPAAGAGRREGARLDHPVCPRQPVHRRGWGSGWRVRVIDPVRIQEPIVALLKLYPLFLIGLPPNLFEDGLAPLTDALPLLGIEIWPIRGGDAGGCEPLGA